MKKRIISVLVIICLLLQMQLFGTVTADEGEIYQPYASSAEFLKALDIVGDEVDFTTNVTRGKAADYIAKMLDEKNMFLEYRGIFTDVSSENENALAIEKLSDLGVVRGDGDYRYRPDDLITYNEATRLFVNALGYGVMDDINSTFYSIAKREGISDGVKNEYTVVNSGDFFLMMYNTLMARPFMQENWGNNLEYFVSGQSLLYKIYRIVYDDGVVVKNDLTYLWSPQANDADKVEIELADKSRLTLVTDNSVGLRDDLGKKVTVFYKYDETLGEKVYVHHTVKQVNKILKISLDAIDFAETDIESRKVEYYPAGKDSAVSVNIASDYNIIYNNVAYKSHLFDFTDAENKTGYLELIDAGGDGGYETVKIKIYDTVIVGNKSTEYDFITDKFDKTRNVNTAEDSYKKIFVYDKNGREITLDEISVGSIISVAVSDASYSDENVLEIHMSTDYINGKITNYKKNAYPPVLEIDYDNSCAVFDRAKEASYVLNSNVIVYLDAFGNAVYVSDDYARDMNYGIITRLGYEPDELRQEIEVRYINSAGELVETKLAENVVIDNESYKDNASGAYSWLSSITTKVDGITVAGGVIPMRYKANEDGSLRLIDTAKSTSEDVKDSFEFVGGGKLGVISGNILGWTVPFSSDALVVEIYADDFNDVDEYEKSMNIDVKVASSAVRNGEHNVLAYKSDKDNMYSDFIIRFVANNFDYGDSFFVVDEVAEGYNQAREKAMYQLNGYLMGAYTEVFVSETASGYDNIIGLKKGDVIRYRASKDNCIVNYEPILIHNDDGSIALSNVGGGGLNPSAISSVTILCGYVYEKEDVLLKTNQYGFAAFTPDAKSVKWATETLRYSGLSAATPVVVVDESDEIVEEGTANDILDYKNFDENCSLVLLRFRSGTLNEAVVFNK